MTSLWKSRALRPAVSRLDSRIERVSRAKIPPLVTQTEFDALKAEFSALKDRFGALKAEFDATRPRLFALELLLGPAGRNKSRIPTKGQIQDLCKEITATTGIDNPYTQVVLAYRTLIELELRGVGRIAGGTMNILGKLTTTSLLAPPNGITLEIGTLYGIFSGGMTRQLTRRGLEYDLTIVDPLADVQLQPDWADLTDPSGTPVSEPVAKANLALAGVDPARLRVFRGFSEDPQLRKQVSDRTYGVIVIDGDHSEQGVRQDLEWAEEISAPGGIVVIDDYGDKNWPGVTTALDTHLTGTTRFERLGKVSTSAFLRAR